MSVVFIFSGFVKTIDPLGLAYKFHDYFEAFGWDFLIPLALVFAFLLSIGELIIGLCLFFKIRMKETGWALLLFMAFFTLLTLFIAITNPVSDCGCFGDAVILTNWQTFLKNVIFFFPTLLIFQQRKEYAPIFTGTVQWVLVISMGIAALCLSLHCYYDLPLIDFRPYRVGTHIPSDMVIPEGMPADEYETILVYEKEGVAREFTLDSELQPWNDSTWHWVETRNVLVKEGYEPPIHDFNLTSFESIDITDSVLYSPDYTFLIVAYDLNKASKRGLEKIDGFAEQAVQNGYRVYGMTSSVLDVVREVDSVLNPSFEFYITDEITLKTMIRSNPGLMLLKEGTIIGKWHYRNIPGKGFFRENGLSYALKENVEKKDDYLSVIVILVLGSMWLLMAVFRMKLLPGRNGKKKK
jgi:hypothetical protein